MQLRISRCLRDHILAETSSRGGCLLKIHGCRRGGRPDGKPLQA